jgi:hypothetical protein
VDGTNVFTRAPQVGLFDVKAKPGTASPGTASPGTASPGSAEHYQIWALSNHYSSGPDSRVGQRREQAGYGAAIVTAIEATHPNARVIYGGDLNVFPRPDDPVPASPGDQLGPLYRAGLHNLWDDLVADVPAAAYSYVFEGQAQTLDNLFVNDDLYGDLIEMRSAHLNADWSAGGDRGTSDHDPQVVRFQSRAGLRGGDVSVTEGDRGTTPMVFPVTLSRPLSHPLTVCATATPGTAHVLSDFDPYAGCKTIPAGATTTSFTVKVHGDRSRESAERLTLTIAGLDPDLRAVDTRATGTILNDD